MNYRYFMYNTENIWYLYDKKKNRDCEAAKKKRRSIDIMDGLKKEMEKA